MRFSKSLKIAYAVTTRHLLKIKINNGNSRTMCKICNIHENVVNGVVLATLLFTLNRFCACSGVSIVDFEQVNSN